MEQKEISRQNISSGTKWEDFHGYSRAVKINDRVIISGTTAVDNKGNIVGLGSVYDQTKYIFQKIAFALKDANATLEDVVRTRIYTVDIGRWEEIAKAHNEFFKEIKPASTLIEISKLINEDLLVEIEAEAVIMPRRKGI